MSYNFKFLRLALRYDNLKLITSQVWKNREKLLLSSLPVSPSRELRAPGTSSYHLVPKHLHATWPRLEQSHLLPEACSPNGTDNRQQRQRRTKRLPPEPSHILKRFHALFDDRICYYKKKASELLYLPSPYNPSVLHIDGRFWLNYHEKLELYVFNNKSKFL